ncbi:MAG TPA: hypothetical protein VEL07_19845 [Planctomycetota bacterium]|nr:hypothetical protein [Planctomycetota bacterium]
MTIDIAAIARSALGYAERLVPSWLPNGQARGTEWIAANPKRPTSDGSGAFSINLHTGKWGDFAGSAADRGGDLVALYAYLNDLNQGQAARAVAHEIGYGLDDAPRSAVARQATPLPMPVTPAMAAASDADLVIPVPHDAPDHGSILTHPQLGRAQGHWIYREASGATLFIVVRFADPMKPGGKEIRPYTLRRMPSGALAWKPKGLPTPRPLYRLDELARHPTATVIVCEGEKAADAAQQLLPAGYVATTSPNGAKNASKADWTPLAGRRVIIWPDHDDPGIGYANDVIREATAVGAAAIEVIAFDWLAAARDDAAPRREATGAA